MKISSSPREREKERDAAMVDEVRGRGSMMFETRALVDGVVYIQPFAVGRLEIDQQSHCS